MKALSLWQPWASAIAIGAKRIETRHWSTTYRGPLAIHAAKRRVQAELDAMRINPAWVTALCPLDRWWAKGGMPFGAVVAVCDLVDVRPSESFTRDELRSERRREDAPGGPAWCWTEDLMGNFSPGRFGWVLANVRPLAAPVAVAGRQQLFHVPDDLLEGALP